MKIFKVRPSDFIRLGGMVLLALLLLAGFVYSLISPAVLHYPDENEYLALSSHLREGSGYSLDGVHLTAIRPPGYPLFLVAIQSLGGGIVTIRLIQFILLVATILLISRFWLNRESAGLLILTTLVLLYPVLFYTAGTLYPQTLGGFLFVLALSQFVMKKRGFILNLTTGLTFGILIMVVPTFLFTLFVALGVAYILKVLGGRDIFIVLVSASMLIGAWTLRNAHVFHHFVPIASDSGANFLLGNNENTIPTGGSANIDVSHYIQQANALHLDEIERNAFFQNIAWQWMTNHPGQAFILYCEKVLNFFNFRNEFAKENSVEISDFKQLIMAMSYGLMLVLLIWRLLDRRNYPLSSREKLFVLLYFLSAFTQAIFFTRIRLRLPYDYLLIAVISMYLTRRLSHWLDSSES